MRSDIGGQRKKMDIGIERPTTAGVVRTSYQDSNIFQYKDRENPTWQNPAKDERHVKTRQNNTWKSSIFDGPTEAPSRRGKTSNYMAARSHITPTVSASIQGDSVYKQEMAALHSVSKPSSPLKEPEVFASEFTFAYRNTNV